MVYCAACKTEVEPEAEDVNGFSCCPLCGRVLEDTTFSTDVTFQKDAGGESTVLGQFVSESGQARGLGRVHGGRVYSSQTDSHERAQQKGRNEIVKIVNQLRIEPREETIESAHRLYRLALQRGFTRGRRINQVAATCIYLLCRQDSKPFLLIDFSDQLQVNVFTLGAVFLQLARLLRMDEHPMLSRPVDPSLYIHRFASKLGFEEEVAGGEHQNEGGTGGYPAPRGRRREDLTLKVAQTAMRLVSSMKRDWIQTGRRPSGICGAALYIASHIHGRGRPKSEVIRVVHVGEATLARRLQEFSATEAGGLTPADFDEQHRRLEAARHELLEGGGSGSLSASLASRSPQVISGDDLVANGSGCEHVRIGNVPQFAHGMCHPCYVDFLERSGGLFDGANPPAFTRAREREEAAVVALANLLEAPEEGNQTEIEEENDLAADMALALNAAELRPFRKLYGGATPVDGEQAEGEAGLEDGGARTMGNPATTDASAPSDEDAPNNITNIALSGDVAAPETQEPTSEPVPSTVPRAPEASALTKRPRAVFQRWKPRKKKPTETLTLDDAARLATDVLSQQGSGVDAGADRQETSLPSDNGPERESSASVLEPLASFLETGEGPSASQNTRPTEEEEDDEAGLSDILDDDIDIYLADEAEVAYKEEIWNMMNRDWLERQAAKAAVAAATEKAAAEQRAAQEAAEAAGVAFKRSRGRPLGSKSKPRPDSGLPPPDTPQEAAMRMLDNRKLSSKINYNVLADLFDDPVPESTAPTAGSQASAAAERESAALSAELAASQNKGSSASLSGLGAISALRPSGLGARGVGPPARLGSLRPAGLASPRASNRRVRFA